MMPAVGSHHSPPQVVVEPAEAAEVAHVLHALSAASRVQLLGVLIDRPANVGELADATGIERSLVSHQLAVLRDAGLVAGDKHGRRIVYSLHDPHVADLLAQALAHVEHRRAGRRHHDPESRVA